MKYALVGKNGKVVKTFKDADKANRVLTKLDEPGARIIEVHPAVVQGIATAGKIRRYTESTINRVIECLEAGKTAPRYALYMDGILLAYFKSEEDAKFMRRKARGFAKRVLQRKFRFTVDKMALQIVQAAA